MSFTLDFVPIIVLEEVVDLVEVVRLLQEHDKCHPVETRSRDAVGHKVWRQCVLVNRPRGIGPKTFGPFRKIAEDFGGSASCDTQPNCRTCFTIATALLSPPFFGFLWRYVLKFHGVGTSLLSLT